MGQGLDKDPDPGIRSTPSTLCWICPYVHSIADSRGFTDRLRSRVATVFFVASERSDGMDSFDRRVELRILAYSEQLGHEQEGCQAAWGGTTMKLIVLGRPGGLENLKISHGPAPAAPKSGEILVRMHGSSLNYHDYAIALGYLPTADGRIPLSDGAGVVEAVGEGVDEFQMGDGVVSVFFPTWHEGPPRIGDFKTTPGDGVDGYARELVVRPASWFTRLPDGYRSAEAATLTTAGLTAWRALVAEGRLKAGDIVLTMGTGGVSIFALQFAQMMGAKVIATSSSDEKAQRLRELGACEVINYKNHENWGRIIREMTDGRGVDHVIEVGGPGTLPQSIDAVRVGGIISLIGVLTGRSGDIPTSKLMAKQVRLQGILVGSRAQQMEMVRAIEVNGVRPVVDRSFSLDDLANAFRYEGSGRHFGKICLEW